MTRDEFITRWLDEFVGCLLGGFAIEHERSNPLVGDEANAKVGRFFIQQQRRAKDMLGRMWDSMQPRTPDRNGQQVTGVRPGAQGATKATA